MSEKPLKQRRDIHRVWARQVGEQTDNVDFQVVTTASKEIKPMSIKPGDEITAEKKAALKAIDCRKRKETDTQMSSYASRMLDDVVRALRNGEVPDERLSSLDIAFPTEEMDEVAIDDVAKLSAKEIREREERRKKEILLTAMGETATSELLGSQTYPQIISKAKAQAQLDPATMKDKVVAAAEKLGSERLESISLTEDEGLKIKNQLTEQDNEYMVRKEYARTKSMQTARRRYRRAGQYVLDDLGIEEYRMSEEDARRLKNLIDKRKKS